MALYKFTSHSKIRNIIGNYTCFKRKLSDTFKKCEFDIVVVGGGIIGVTAAREILKRNPSYQVKIVEKEDQLALHQSGHNSGVVHAGIYYKPGSLKAKLCGQGLRLMYQYCEENNVPFKKIGKLIVATTPAEVEGLAVLEDRGRKNKVPDLKVLEGKQIQEIEPYCKGLKALWSPHTGIVDFSVVTHSCARDFQELGGKIQLNFEVVAFEEDTTFADYPVVVKAKDGNIIRAKYVLTCGGLYSDKLARMSNCPRDPQIVPFRGEYLILHHSKNHMIRGNIYPVPDPRFPFLGVHFTPRMDGTVLLGPNAVLGFAREGYAWSDVNLREFWETVTYKGFRSMALKYLKPGSREMIKSLITSIQMKDLQRYIPEITVDHVKKGPAGVRAQAMLATGELVEDFVFSKGEGPHASRILHCRNTPSPAGTSSFAIANLLVNKLKQEYKLEL